MPLDPDLNRALQRTLSSKDGVARARIVYEVVDAIYQSAKAASNTPDFADTNEGKSLGSLRDAALRHTENLEG